MVLVQMCKRVLKKVIHGNQDYLLLQHGTAVVRYFNFFDLPDNCREHNIGDSIQNETWRFLAGTWDGTTIKLYIDGELNKELECKG